MMLWNRTPAPPPIARPAGRPTLTTVAPVPAGTLELRGVSREFVIDRQPRPAIEGIDLRIEPGEFVCIVGASGCGKSTLLRLISGLDTDYEGGILIDGRKITGPDLDRGIVFQDHRLFPWMSIAENVGLALLNRDIDKPARAALVADHLALVGLGDFANAYPHQLSGGMAQRAAIARSLVNDPRILLLDEPLGALDALTRLKVRGELERIWLKQRSTMIMVTHDVAEAVHLAGRIVVMAGRPGRIIEIVAVDATYPRERSASQLQAIETAILGLIMRH